jgi:hypothetical protein
VVTKNYYRKRQIGAHALWDVATETGEIATAVLVLEDGVLTISIRSLEYPGLDESEESGRWRILH